jgi:membrane carboxypeptidase/penicillin-binding protein
MNFRRILWLALAAVSTALLGIAVWEAYAVWRAESRTADILAAWQAKPQPLALASLSPEQKEILLKVEDPGFYGHSGVDVSSPGQGMTTITQGLVKLLYFDPFRPGFAKIEQSLIARFALNRHLSKDRQLALFINHAYLGAHRGRQIHGFTEASLAYFGKPFDALSRDEYIGLVGMLIGPNEFRPDNPGAYNERVARIKALLAGQCKPTGVFDPHYDGCASRS